MIVQWFFVNVAERAADDIAQGVHKIRPAAIIDRVKVQKRDSKGNAVIDAKGNSVMIEKNKYEYTQWGAAYYPLSAKNTHKYSHAILRTESKKPLIISDPLCVELRNKADWDKVKAIYPELKQHWSDQPGANDASRDKIS